MTRLAVVLLLALLPSIPAAAEASAPASVVLVVDLDRIFEECRACKAAGTEFEARKSAVIVRLEQRQNETYSRMVIVQDALKDTDKLPEAKRDAAKNGLADELSELNRMFQADADERESQIEYITSLQTDVVKQFRAGIAPILEDIRNERGAVAVINKDSILAYTPMIDVTFEAAARLNAAAFSIMMPPPLVD